MAIAEEENENYTVYPYDLESEIDVQIGSSIRSTLVVPHSLISMYFSESGVIAGQVEGTVTDEIRVITRSSNGGSWSILPALPDPGDLIAGTADTHQLDEMEMFITASGIPVISFDNDSDQGRYHSYYFNAQSNSWIVVRDNDGAFSGAFVANTFSDELAVTIWNNPTITNNFSLPWDHKFESVRFICVSAVLC